MGKALPQFEGVFSLFPFVHFVPFVVTFSSQIKAAANDCRE
jgi:hypothetical protein